MIQKTACIIAMLVLPCVVLACTSGSLTCTLDELATSQNLEAVYGDRFPEVNPYGSYGSPYVLDFVSAEGVERSVLFLARRKIDAYKSLEAKSPLDLVRYFDYFWIYATKGSQSRSFEVKDVIEDGVALMGMSLYYGEMGIDAKQFSYIGSEGTLSGSSLDRRKLSTAILMSGQSSTTLLYLYDGKWIRSVEREW